MVTVTVTCTCSATVSVTVTGNVTATVTVPVPIPVIVTNTASHNYSRYNSSYSCAHKSQSQLQLQLHLHSVGRPVASAISKGVPMVWARAKFETRVRSIWWNLESAFAPNYEKLETRIRYYWYDQSLHTSDTSRSTEDLQMIYRWSTDDPVPKLPFGYLVWDLYSPDPTQEKCARSCRIYGSHPATWATSYRSGICRYWNIYITKRESMLCPICDMFGESTFNVIALP